MIKNLFFTFALIVALLAAHSASAQASLGREGLLQVGGGLAYGSEIEQVGLNLHGNYGFTNEIDGVVGINLFMPQRETFNFGGGVNGEITTRFITLNLDGRYNFEIQPGILLYPFAGLNLAFISVESESAGVSVSESDSELGLNLGGGGSYDFTDVLAGFLEVKAVVGNADQAVLMFGVRYSLN